MNILFEWDERKSIENQSKHGVDFDAARYVFDDLKRVIAEDLKHSREEKRYYCFGKVRGGIMTVRFTYRKDKVRIIGAGYWRKGKEIYEKTNKV